MIARGKFRDNPAVVGVHGHLAVQGMREYAAMPVVQGNAGLITGCFDTENLHHVRIAAGKNPAKIIAFLPSATRMCPLC